MGVLVCLSVRHKVRLLVVRRDELSLDSTPRFSLVSPLNRGDPTRVAVPSFVQEAHKAFDTYRFRSFDRQLAPAGVKVVS